jgi:hypothetical protein
MTMRLLLMVLLLTACWSVSAATASDPFKVGWPGCRGGERGYYGHVQRLEPGSHEYRIYTAVLARPFMDPANVICWLPPDSEIEAIERPPSGVLPSLRR